MAEAFPIKPSDFAGTMSKNRVNSYLRERTCDIPLVGSGYCGDGRLVYGQDRHLPVQYEADSKPTFGANRFFGDGDRILPRWTYQPVD